LMEAGAEPLPSGCGACIGLGKGTLEPGEVGISATNRNFKGRMGSRDAKCYLASPAVVAASAIEGHIAAPWEFRDLPTVGSCKVNAKKKEKAGKVRIIEGFPGVIEGRALYLPQDNLNTDGIYGKDVTYRDDITFDQQGQYAMLNYDPEFQQKAKDGDVIVAGRNFGTGSSREQAATALASRGIRLVIAASFSETYARNAYNNGFMCIQCPELVDFLAEELAAAVKKGEKTIEGPAIRVDFAGSVIECGGKSFDFPALSPVAQELVAAGGSENVVRKRLEAGA
ncbi:MAG: aconitase family protein, partial [Planctomycetota bacterium]|nr:aconitase family protein [Planctomycetota bacterium]